MMPQGPRRRSRSNTGPEIAVATLPQSALGSSSPLTADGRLATSGLRGVSALVATTSIRGAAWALGLVLLLARPAVPCSTVTSGIGGPVLGSDGLVHWTAPGRPAAGKSVGPYGFDHEYWITRTSLHGEPEALRVGVPAIREGHLALVGVLPDGSSWWRTSCSDWDPPRTVACYSLLLRGPAGEPLGRVSTARWGRLHLESDGTLLSLEVASQSSSARPAGAGSVRAPQRMLQLWRGTPQPLEAFDQRPDNRWWDDDYRRRLARFPRDGWELEWEAPLPFSYGDHARVIWTLNPATLHDRGDGPLVAAVVAEGERVLAGVFRAEVGRGSAPAGRLEVVWQREYPHARNGLAEDPNGNLALAPPSSLAVSTRGELAMGDWAIHSDCSRDRPAGFLVLDGEGDLLADVRSDEMGSSVEGLAFDGEDRLVAATWPDIVTYSIRGEELGTAPRTPTYWQQEDARLLDRARALTAASPLEDWAELYPLASQIVDARGRPDRELWDLGARLLVAGWPRIEPLLTDNVWLELGERICDAHPEAAQAALRRFEAAWGYAQERWLQALPECFDEPPTSALALAKEWLELRDSSRSGAAKEALARWPAPAGAVDELWTQVIAAHARDSAARHEAGGKHQQLLATVAEHREELETRLRAGGNARRAAVAVLFSSFERFRPEYVSREDVPIRDALLEMAREWASGDDEDTRTLGTLLLLGHGAWRGTATAIDSELRPIDRALSRVLDRGGTEQGDLPLWATIAISRALQQRVTRSPDDSRMLLLPSPEQVGLRTDLVLALFTTATAAADAADQDRWLQRSWPYIGFEHARHLVLRSLGGPGRDLLLQEARLFERTADRRASRRLWELVTRMAEDLAPWDERDVRWVLGRMQGDPNAGWQSAPMLDAVVRAYPADHELHRTARAMFRAHIQEAIALASAPETSSRATRGPSRSLVLPQMIMHLADTDFAPREPSPLLAELTVSDVEAIAGGASSGFESWLSLMAISGPWPAAVPELERLLQGNQRLQAAVVLSHVEHPQALPALLEGIQGPGDSLAALARALARYGAAGVEPLLERLTQPAVAADHRTDYRQRAARTLLARVVVDHPELVRQVKGERLSAVRATLSAAVAEALDRGAWPDGASILLHDVLDTVLDGFLDAQTSRGSSGEAARHAGHDSALGRTLSAVERLPTDADSVRSFLFGYGEAVSGHLLRHLAELAADPQNPLRDAVIAAVRPLADEGADQARWVIQRAEGQR